ncbi:MAG: aldo/keto reductase [Jatrophihabitantaceae bacterium]
MSLERRRIGTTGPEVSVLALGSWHTYDRIDFHACVQLLRAAIDAGITFFDVGVYGGVPVDGPGSPISYSHTDVIFGRAMEVAGVAREEYVLSEKLWLEQWPERGLGEQLQRALDRVGTDYADFAVLGDIRTPDLDLHRLVEDLAEVVRSGRLRSWGVNNWSVANLRRTHEIAREGGLPGPQLAQLKYSVCRRAVADGEPFRELFAESGISLEASDIFEGGILAGSSGSARPVGRDPGDLRPSIADAAPRAAAIAAELGVTPAQLAVAFCLTHAAAATVLFGASRIEQLQENLGALDLLRRVGADALRERVTSLALDAGIVDPSGA